MDHGLGVCSRKQEVCVRASVRVCVSGCERVCMGVCPYGWWVSVGFEIMIMVMDIAAPSA